MSKSPMNCEDTQARYLTGEFDDAMRSHLSSCPACRSALAGLDRLREALADPQLWEEPPPELADRVTASVLVEACPRGVGSWGLRRLAAAVAVVVVVAGGLLGWRAWEMRPDWEVELVPTPAAPTAAVVVAGWNTDTGTRMELDVSGLPPARDGFYEVWLTDEEGRHISAGTFRDSGTVTVWAGVRRSDFPRIWITLEPIDDDPGPSAVTVLDTEL